MFIMSSFLGGAAKRGSEIMEEERRNTQKIVDNTMRLWTELGVPAYKERKQKRKDLSMKFETLSNYGYSGDQIEIKKLPQVNLVLILNLMLQRL